MFGNDSEAMTVREIMKGRRNNFKDLSLKRLKPLWFILAFFVAAQAFVPSSASVRPCQTTTTLISSLHTVAGINDAQVSRPLLRLGLVSRESRMGPPPAFQKCAPGAKCPPCKRGIPALPRRPRARPASSSLVMPDGSDWLFLPSHISAFALDRFSRREKVKYFSCPVSLPSPPRSPAHGLRAPPAD